jgi:deoxycytidylate deaminase
MNKTIENDIYWLQKCIEYSHISEDLSTKNCSIVIPTDDQLFVSGVNNIPAKLFLKDRLHKPEKLKYTTHAERKCIYNCAKLGRRTEGSTMYATWIACIPCANAIIEAGIKKVVSLLTDVYDDSSWAQEVKEGTAMMEEAGLLLVKQRVEGKVFVKGNWVEL